MENGKREEEVYDRAKEVKQFEDSKTGVKRLLDSGNTSIPRFLIRPPESLPCTAVAPPPATNIIPTIILSGFESDHRSIINHGIPSKIIDWTIASIKAFNEQPPEMKVLHYCHDMGRSVSYSSNYDLYVSKAASWRTRL
ncbi:hypothetical protein NE237_006836 [Protea cynaroides]|uniref:Uncharacterized protein n=1 Tax=Protea cynaroides TaxID=273540 RepID=A0A9Q0QVU1_9MAGN|nr:hypothetical protein NE237_006836 [Protea cynaroides]